MHFKANVLFYKPWPFLLSVYMISNTVLTETEHNLQQYNENSFFTLWASKNLVKKEFPMYLGNTG